MLPRSNVIAILRTNGLYVTGTKKQLNERLEIFQSIFKHQIIPPTDFQQQIGRKGLQILLKKYHLPITGDKPILWYRLFRWLQSPKNIIDNSTIVYDKSFTTRFIKIQENIDENTIDQSAVFTMLELYSIPNYNLITNLYLPNYDKQEEYEGRMDYYWDNFDEVLIGLQEYDYYKNISPRETARRLVYIAKTIPNIKDILKSFSDNYYSIEDSNIFVVQMQKYFLGV
jgi:hypothetical protein